MSENKIKELEDEIQSLHDSIEEEQAELYNKREELKILKDPNWKEKEEQLKIKEFLKNTNLEEWKLEESGQFKGSYMHNSRTMAFSIKPVVILKKLKYKKITVNLFQLREIVNLYNANFSNYLELYFENDSKILIFYDGNIFGYTSPRESEEEEEEEEEDEEEEETEEIVVKIVEGKHKTEFGKIQELQKLINKAKNLIFAAQDIDCTIDYPYCSEIEKEKPNTSMSSELLEVRSTLEWMDNMCWSYRGLKQ